MNSLLRRFALPCLVALLALGLLACGDEGGGETDVAQSDFAAVTEAPDDAQEGGTLDVIAAGDVDFMDPGAAYYQFSYMVLYPMHRPLYSWEPAETDLPNPDLAAGEPGDLEGQQDDHDRDPRRRPLQPAGGPGGDLGRRRVRDRARPDAGRSERLPPGLLQRARGL